MSDFDHLIVTTDFSDAALQGVLEGRELAVQLKAKVTLLYVVEDRLPPIVVAMSAAGRSRQLDEHRQDALESLSTYALEHLPDVDVESVVEVGVPHEVIVAEAKRREADLIVIATHGYGFVGSFIFGSTSERVMRHADCPVMVVRSSVG